MKISKVFQSNTHLIVDFDRLQVLPLLYRLRQVDHAQRDLEIASMSISEFWLLRLGAGA